MKTFGGSLVLANTILGPGILSVPWGVSRAGFGLGTLLVLFAALAAMASLYLLALCALRALQEQEAKEGPGSKQRRLTLGAMASVAGAGQAWELGVDVANTVACLGAMATSMVGAADQLASLVGPMGPFHWVLLSRREAFGLTWLFWVLPLSFAKDLAPLRYSATLCLAVCVYLALLVPALAGDVGFLDCHLGSFVDPLTGEIVERGQAALVPVGGPEASQMLLAVPIFTFCFCGHMTVAGLVQDLDGPTSSSLNVVVVSATFAAMLVFGSVGFAGYYGFGDTTPSDLMLALPNCPPVSLARLGLTIMCLCFFPLLLQAVRATVMAWIDRMAGSHSSGLEDGLISEGPRAASIWSYRLVTAAIALFGLVIGLFVAKLGTVISLAGSTGFVILCYIFPGRCYLLMFPEGKLRGLAWALVIGGIVMGPTCVIANLLPLFE